MRGLRSPEAIWLAIIWWDLYLPSTHVGRITNFASVRWSCSESFVDFLDTYFPNFYFFPRIKSSPSLPRFNTKFPRFITLKHVVTFSSSMKNLVKNCKWKRDLLVRFPAKSIAKIRVILDHIKVLEKGFYQSFATPSLDLSRLALPTIRLRRDQRTRMICQNWQARSAASQLKRVSSAELRAFSGQTDPTLEGWFVWCKAALLVRQTCRFTFA